MKKCPRCHIAFHSSQRSRCVYCDTMLLTVSKDDTPSLGAANTGIGGFKADQPVIKQFLQDRRIEGLGRMQYLIGSYFRSRTFHFMYAFCRNEFRMGKPFKRLLIQPLTIGSFLTLPWVVFNVFDSMWARLVFSAYCPRCGWKYAQVSGGSEHDPFECQYSQEYGKIIDDIMTGKIGETEDQFRAEALKKINAGQRSAYRDLCSSKSVLTNFVDIVTIWFSICILVSFLVWLFLPLLSKILPWLNR